MPLTDFMAPFRATVRKNLAKGLCVTAAGLATVGTVEAAGTSGAAAPQAPSPTPITHVDPHRTEFDPGGTLRRAPQRAKAPKPSTPFKHLGKGWEQPYTGVRTKTLAVDGQTVHAIAVDMHDPRVRLTMNAPQREGDGFARRSVEDWAKSMHATFAVNGDYFTFDNGVPTGRSVTGGKPWEPAQWQDENWEPAFEFNGHEAQVMRPYSGKLAGWAKDAIGGRPIVLEDGKVVSAECKGSSISGCYRPGEMNKASPTARTGMGVSKDGRMLYILASTGDEEHGIGLTGAQFGTLMKRLGAYNAISNDTGGSAQMYQAGRGMVQSSTDPGGVRPVSDVFAVSVRPRR